MLQYVLDNTLYVEAVMQKLVTVKLSNTLYDWVNTHAIQNDLTLSQVIRHALRVHTKFPDTAERPRELSPIKSFDQIQTPTKPNIVMGEAERQRIADEWSADEY